MASLAKTKWVPVPMIAGSNARTSGRCLYHDMQAFHIRCDALERQCPARLRQFRHQHRQRTGAQRAQHGGQARAEERERRRQPLVERARAIQRRHLQDQPCAQRIETRRLDEQIQPPAQAACHHRQVRAPRDIAVLAGAANPSGGWGFALVAHRRWIT